MTTVPPESSASPTALSVEADAVVLESQTVLPSVTSESGGQSIAAAASVSNHAQQDDASAAGAPEVMQTRAAIASEVECSVQEHLLYGTSESSGPMSDASLHVRLQTQLVSVACQSFAYGPVPPCHECALPAQTMLDQETVRS